LLYPNTINSFSTTFGKAKANTSFWTAISIVCMEEYPYAYGGYNDYSISVTANSPSTTGMTIGAQVFATVNTSYLVARYLIAMSDSPASPYLAMAQYYDVCTVCPYTVSNLPGTREVASPLPLTTTDYIIHIISGFHVAT
jgi:hypothetical protein